LTSTEIFITVVFMKIYIPKPENYLYELLKKKYHTSEVVRAQIAEIKGEIAARVVKEPLKSFTARFKGQVIDTSFEKTLRIVSKRLFNKAKIESLETFREEGVVEANIVATLAEMESLIQYLMKPRLVLHCKRGIVKGASNLLIIDETEQDQLNNFTPDYVHRNFVVQAEIREKYVGRLGEYVILNGLPLTSEKIGRELRFNKIETKNRVFTTTGLKEIYVNLQFISLILKLDLEQHYLKLKIFNSQENDIRKVEDKIDGLGFFSDVLNHISAPDNPLLFRESLCLDLVRIEHIIGNNNWKTMPAYAGYVYSAIKKLNDQFKLLEEYNLFLTYAKCIEKFISKLSKKVSKHKADILNDRKDLTANYHELQRLRGISEHPLLQKDYQALLSSFNQVLAYLDFLMIHNVKNTTENDSPDTGDPTGKFIKNFGTVVKKCIEFLFSVTIDISVKTDIRHDQSPSLKQEEELQRLIMKFHNDLKKFSHLRTDSGGDAFLEARKCVPQLTNLSYILDRLKELIKHIESGMAIQEPFKDIFDKSDKFEILYREVERLGILKTTDDQEACRKILVELQGLLFSKPLKEALYPEIIKCIQSLEHRIINNTVLPAEKSVTITELLLNPTFKNIFDIRTIMKSIIEKDANIQKIGTCEADAEFFCYSAKELSGFMEALLKFYEKLKNTCYYKNVSEYNALENKFEDLIEEMKGIDARISHYTRSSDKKVSREPNINIDYLRNSQLERYNLEKAIFLLQNQIARIYEFATAIENHLHRHSFVHSGVATSVLFDQITFVLSSIDVRLIEMTELTEQMFEKCVDTIFHYQTGETFAEPKREDLESLMKEIESRTIVRTYQNREIA